MKKDSLYEDSLIIIRDDSIILKHYYSPFISKTKAFANIDKSAANSELVAEILKEKEWLQSVFS